MSVLVVSPATAASARFDNGSRFFLYCDIAVATTAHVCDATQCAAALCELLNSIVSRGMQCAARHAVRRCIAALLPHACLDMTLLGSACHEVVEIVCARACCVVLRRAVAQRRSILLCSFGRVQSAELWRAAWLHTLLPGSAHSSLFAAGRQAASTHRYFVRALVARVR
jgi:hypothetical protein